MKKLTLFVLSLALIAGCARKAKNNEEPPPGPGGGPAPLNITGPYGPTQPLTPIDVVNITSAVCPNGLDAQAAAKETLPEDAITRNDRSEWKLVSVDTHLVLQEGYSVAAIATSTELSPLADEKNPSAIMNLTCRDLVMLPKGEVVSDAEFPASITKDGEIDREFYVKTRTFGSQYGRDDSFFYNSRTPTRRNLSQLFKMEQEKQSQDKDRVFKIMRKDENTLLIYTQNRVEISNRNLTYIETAIGKYVAVNKN